MKAVKLVAVLDNCLVDELVEWLDNVKAVMTVELLAMWTVLSKVD